ncbi:UDP-N-acetylglucosamine 2-epimerase (hydrolyzing) [Legionella sp. 27fs60]|uniref:UDP-N-acetylglucosamine 2-epimerase (Hydrolyzing) n=2 Tax=Legionella bononiensis TaxID=2793102 RepID=A0ABS1W7V7_9GAMM|nr:UDP-N-acetylglucosamine 2-epimerase (hydrolyzing) [Legionella bononiensis]MBL7525446.1 UDP-N-acetylglucosamine 2-epimerase (hydrolyzing) [Legionella bononiensis]MBL7561629.1 UDP-N-acetylglucosamine 2-epimerase (hydrolyzing) [Legionella bononiensis]
MRRKIIYVTGTRADYGLMREVLKRLDASEHIELLICVTGMHLSTVYGNTVEEIESDGLTICGRIAVDVENTTHIMMSKSIGYEILGMTDVFAQEKPDLILLLGDRGEMLAAAISAVHLNIPLVHLHGGERSGTVDEMIRHAISKLSHYHFVATENSKQRLIKMGEQEESVFVVGAPGLEAIKNYKITNKESIYQRFGFSSNKKMCLCIYHPVVQEYNELKNQFRHVIDAALAVDLQVICLEPNSDAGGHLIREVIKEYSEYPDVKILKHLPRAEFIDCLAHVDVMLGNSSSGIIEAASFNLPVVNVGSRQNLRDRSDNVIDVSTSYDSIRAGLQEALQRSNEVYTNCYGDGMTSEKCYKLLTTLPLNNHILNKCNAY